MSRRAAPLLAGLGVAGVLATGLHAAPWARTATGLDSTTTGSTTAGTAGAVAAVYPREPSLAEVASVLASPLPSTPPGYRTPDPAGDVPIPGTLTWGPTPVPAAALADEAGTDRTICARPATVQTGALAPADRARLLGLYRVPASRVAEWDLLVPVWLGGSASDPANVWPMTSPQDAALKHQLETWTRTALCAGWLPAADAVARIREYPAWWGPGSPADPAAASAWYPPNYRGYR